MFEIKLIQQIKKYECIYNKDHVDFRNKEIKDDCWYAIEFALGTSEEKCRLRWKTLRERYVKEFLQMVSDENYKSQWRFAELMSFMQPYIEPRSFYGGPKSFSEGKTNNYIQQGETDDITETTPTHIVNCTSKKFEKILISHVKKCPIIYDKDHPDFRNRTKKDETWVNIAQAIGTTERLCRNRWKSLRDRIVVEYSKYETVQGYISCWNYFKDMSFMKYYLTPKAIRRQQLPKICEQDMYCRTCFHQILNDTGEKSCSSLNIYETPNLLENLENCSNIQVESKDDYPNSVCDMCYEKILDIHQFQLMCRDSLEKFKELQTPVKHEHEDTLDSFKDPTNICYNEERLIKNEADTSSSESEADNVESPNESLDQLKLKYENNLDEDPLAEQLTSIEAIYEFITPAEALTDTNISNSDVEWNIERIPTPQMKIKNKTKQNSNFIKDLNDSRNISYKRSNNTSRTGNISKFETINMKIQASEIVESEDKYSDEMIHSDDSIVGDEIKGNSSSRRLIYKCDICPKSYEFKYRLQAHQRMHKSSEVYSCNIGKCRRNFSRLELLHKHHDDHKTLPVYICNIDDCGRMYKTMFNLREHKRSVHKHNEKNRQANGDGKNEKGYTCEICGKTFTLPLSLRNHRFVHIDKSQWPFACEVEGCSKRFQSLYFLKLHKKRHSGIKNHICSYCGLRTVTLSELNKHINIHTFERKYPCPICPKVCKTSGDRGNHIRRVHGPRPIYTCGMCDATFTTSYNRDHHEMAHKGIKPYSCDVCNKKFKWKTGLKMHTNIVHLGTKPYECDICGKEFMWYGSLTKHKKIHLENNKTKIGHQEDDANREDSPVQYGGDFIEQLEEDSELIECIFEIDTHEIESV